MTYLVFLYIVIGQVPVTWLVDLAPLVDPEVFFRRSTGAIFREQGQKQAKLLNEGVTRGQWAHWRIRKGKKNDYVRGRIVYVRQIGDPDSHAEPNPGCGCGLWPSKAAKRMGPWLRIQRSLQMPSL